MYLIPDFQPTPDQFIVKLYFVVYILSPTLKQNPLGALQKPLAKPTMRSSIEGLNQEIEKLVLKSLSSGGLHCMERSEDFDKVRYPKV